MKALFKVAYVVVATYLLVLMHGSYMALLASGELTWTQVIFVNFGAAVLGGGIGAIVTPAIRTLVLEAKAQVPNLQFAARTLSAWILIGREGYVPKDSGKYARNSTRIAMAALEHQSYTLTSVNKDMLVLALLVGFDKYVSVDWEAVLKEEWDVSVSDTNGMVVSSAREFVFGPGMHIVQI